MLILITSALNADGQGVLNLTHCNKPYYARKPLRLSLASSALLWKAKAFVVANMAYHAMPPLKAGTFFSKIFY